MNINSNKYLKIGLLLFLVSFLPLFVWSIMHQNFEIRKNAQQTSEWPIHLISPGSGGPDGGALADFNKDGKMDAVVPYPGNSEVSLFLSPNDPKSSAWQKVVIGRGLNGPEEVQTGDMNGDSLQDVIVGLETGKEIYILFSPNNPATENWNAVKINVSDLGVIGYNSLAIANIDGKNGPDIIAGLKDGLGNLFWFESPTNPLDGRTWIIHRIDETKKIDGPQSVILIDLDRDSDLDIFAGSRGDQGEVYWFENLGDPLKANNWSPHFIGHDNKIFWSSFSDINNDGLEDVVVAFSGSNKVFWFEQPQNLKSAVSWNQHSIADFNVMGESPSGVATADLNGNGLVDIIVGDSEKGSVHWFEKNSNNSLWSDTLIRTASRGKIDNLILYDFDNDNDQDIFLQDQNSIPNIVFWLENNLNQANTPSPSPSLIPQLNGLDLRIKFAGVSGSEAEGAKVKVRIVKDNYDLTIENLQATHKENGTYSLLIDSSTNSIPAGNGYKFYLKGEKHLAIKFENITISNPISQVIDLTSSPLEPGDLPIQDGVADSNDFKKITDTWNKSSTEVNEDDKKTADLNYDGQINISDAFLMRKTLETKYDEND